jgi:hypothetical protein
MMCNSLFKNKQKINKNNYLPFPEQTKELLYEILKQESFNKEHVV